MNTTFYKGEVDALKEMAQKIESHKPQMEETELSPKALSSVFGIIGCTIIATVGILTWWLLI